MWFKRKPKNRRLEREQVLDVKLRSSQVRAARSRIFALTLGVPLRRRLWTLPGAPYRQLGA